jgi:hypothetical protein
MAQALAFDPRFIHCQLAPGRILASERHVGRVVDNPGQQRGGHRQDAGTQSGGKRLDCAQFHAGL